MLSCIFSSSQTKIDQDSVNYYYDLGKENLSYIVTKSSHIDEKSALKKVIFAADKLIKINPNRIDYFTTKTYAYFISNQYDEFILASEELLKQNNINKGIWYNLDDTNRAKEDVLLEVYHYYIFEMIPRNNKNGKFYLNLISEQFDTYLPKTSEKYLIKAWISNIQGNGYLAIKTLEEGRIKFPNDFYILIQLYEYYLTLNKKDKLNDLKNNVLKQENKELIQLFEEVINNYN